MVREVEASESPMAFDKAFKRVTAQASRQKLAQLER